MGLSLQGVSYYNPYMKVAVGSDNPAKVLPVKKIFTHHFTDVDVAGVFVVSGVAETPLTDTEIFEGAMNRAKGAMEAVQDADFAVGIEGGLHHFSYGWVKYELVIIINKEGVIGIGTSGGLQVPETLVKKLQEGNNLTDVGDELFGTEKIGRGAGIVGHFTKHVVKRADAVEHAVALAISRFLHEDLYQT